jgi:hypothetical protein
VLIMWARLFGEAEKTRFQEYHVEVKMIVPLVDQLRVKQSELKTKATEPDSLEYSKYLIVSRLLAHFDEKLDLFNSKPKEVNYEIKIRSFYCLIKELYAITSSIQQEYTQIIKKPRNSQRKLASNFIEIASIVASGAAASALSFSTFGIGVIALFGGGVLVSGGLHSVTGLNDQSASTYKQINHLSNVLEALHTELLSVIRKWNDPTEKKQIISIANAH